MKLMIFIAVVFFMSACSNLEDTPELVDKLRAMGFQTNQATYSYSTEDLTVPATISILLTSNSATDIDVDSYDLSRDDQLALTIGNNSRQEYQGGLSIFSIETTTTIPRQSELVFSDTDGAAIVSFGITVRQGVEEEIISGRLKIYPPDDPRLAFTAQSIKIVSPEANETTGLGTVTLKAEQTDAPPQRYRIGWLVSKGVIEKPRSIETEWEIEEAGPQTVIVTSRGLDNYTMSFDVLELTVGS